MLRRGISLNRLIAAQNVKGFVGVRIGKAARIEQIHLQPKAFDDWLINPAKVLIAARVVMRLGRQFIQKFRALGVLVIILGPAAEIGAPHPVAKMPPHLQHGTMRCRKLQNIQRRRA
ncbi:hypothetical protein EGN72_16375 [Pseudorhodobacter sp. E13]|nr:hypothetical protein EGN72_16375 [Pseudorhodobacter sp. E13]